MLTTRHAVGLLDAAADSPARVFLRGARPVTFGELAAASHAVAAWLGERGVRPGDRMLIAAANHADAVAAAFGAARLGVTFAFLHHTIRPAGFRKIVEQVEPACVVLDAATEALRAVVAGVPALSTGEAAVADATPVSDVVARGRGRRVESVRRDPLCLVYTSGSSGEPRGVMVSHDNVAFTAQAIQRRLGYRADDTVGLYLPLSFDYGLYQLFLALGARASIFLGSPDLVSLRIADDLADEGVTILPGVPSLFSALARMLERRPRELPRLRAATNTGEHLPPETIGRLRALLPRVELFLMYGLTECKRVSILLPAEAGARPGSVGRPLDGTAAEVVAPDGRPAPDGVAGELVVRGPHVTMGYWRAPEETARRFRPDACGRPALFTGDTCRRDADGYLYFEGRGDSQTKRRGFRISLLEIESAALAVAGAAGAAVVAPPDTDELHLFLAGEGSSVNADAVFRELRERLEPHKIPDRIHVVASLPTTPHGKVDQQRLRALAAGTSP